MKNAVQRSSWGVLATPSFFVYATDRVQIHMKVICSYCRKNLPEKEPFHEGSITHTICQECFEYFTKQWEGQPLEKYLDNFAVPVMIMDADCRVIAANEMAANLTGKPRHEVVGLLGGDAMECCYARFPGGCGKTVHCKTCTIRNAVNRAMKNSSPQFRVPVTVKQDDKEISLKITTYKIGDVVCILIE